MIHCGGGCTTWAFSMTSSWYPARGSLVARVWATSHAMVLASPPPFPPPLRFYPPCVCVCVCVQKWKEDKREMNIQRGKMPVKKGLPQPPQTLCLPPLSPASLDVGISLASALALAFR